MKQGCQKTRWLNLSNNRIESPSSITKFIGCPYAYFLKYIRLIKVSSSVEQAGIGIDIHKVNEKYWGIRRDFASNEAALQESINRNWTIKTDEESNEIINTCFSNFLESIKNNNPPIFIEEKIENPITGTVCIIDRVDIDKIVDYKTGAYFTIKPKVPALIQATLCYENLKYKHGLDFPIVEFQYLRNMKDGKGIQLVEVTPELIEQVHLLINNMRTMITNDIFPKKQSCFFCEYSKICELEKKSIEYFKRNKLHV